MRLKLRPLLLAALAALVTTSAEPSGTRPDTTRSDQATTSVGGSVVQRRPAGTTGRCDEGCLVDVEFERMGTALPAIGDRVVFSRSVHGLTARAEGTVIEVTDDVARVRITSGLHRFDAETVIHATGSLDVEALLDQLRIRVNGGDCDGVPPVVRPLAEEGIADAQNMLGILLARGCGIAQDEEAALDWYRAAAAQGFVKAMANLRMALLERDPTGSLEWARRAYETGGSQWAWALALHLIDGIGIRADVERGLALMREAAEAGNARASNFLMRSYRKGDFREVGLEITPDLEQALKWGRLAVAQGHPGATNDLGIMYATGEGVEQDLQEAVRLFEEAVRLGLDAKNNLARAQYDLGARYANGDGLAKDLHEAIRLFEAAIENGNQSEKLREDLQRARAEIRH